MDAAPQVVVDGNTSDRDKTCPFLMRTFVKVNGFHPLAVFESNKLPIDDEYQIYTWKDASLRELVTYLRSLPPTPLSLTLRHPSARYSFRLLFPDPASRGRITTKELGSIHAKDLLNLSSLKEDALTNTATTTEAEPASATMDVDVETAPAPTPIDTHPDRTLEDLRVVPGDWLSVAVYVPTKALGISIAGASAGTGAAGPPASISPANSRPIRGTAAALGAALGRGGPAGRGAGDAGWGARGRGDPTTSGHWRGGAAGRGAPAGRGAAGRERDPEPDRRPRRPSPTGRDRDRRPSPTGRDRDRDRGSRYRSRSRSPARDRSRSRTPPRRRRD